MAFTPKFPTWNTEVSVYKLNPTLRTYSVHVLTITGQVYTPQRTQDEDVKDTQYFVYPKEKDLLRGYVDYGNIGLGDCIVFGFPINAPRQVGYMVRLVQPRWLHFPNEHLMATLIRLTPAQLEIVLDGEQFPATGDGLPVLPVWNMEFTPYLPHPTLDLYFQGEPFTGQLYALEPMAEVLGYEAMYVFFPKEIIELLNPQDVPQPPLLTTRSQYLRHSWNGRTFMWELNQLVPRYSNTDSEHWMGLIQQVAAVEEADILSKVVSPGVPDLWQLGVITDGNGTCTDCADFNTTNSVTMLSEWYYESSPISWACVAADVKFVFSAVVPDDVHLTLVDAATGVQIFAEWLGTRVGWDGVSAIPLTLTGAGDPTLCDWHVVTDMAPL